MTEVTEEIRFYKDFDMKEFSISIWFAKDKKDQDEWLEKIKDAVEHLKATYDLVDNTITTIGKNIVHNGNTVRVILMR